MTKINPSLAHTSSYIPTIADQQYAPCDVLVLDAHLRQALVTIRSLGKQNLALAAVDSEKWVPAFSSRWCGQQVVFTTEEGTAAYLEELQNLVRQTKAKVLIPCSDGTIALLREHRELFPDTRIAIADEPALEKAVNKDQTLELAQELGLAIPPGLLLRSPDQLEEALREVGLPAVVKPVESWLWGDQPDTGSRLVSRLVITEEEARLALEELTVFGGTVLFQKFLTGRREAVSLFYANGEVHASFAQWAKRTEPPLGGQSVLRQSIPMPEDIGVQSEKLIRAMNLEGYSEVEYRRDEQGKAYLMEINPRLSASVEIAVRSGVDFPYLLYLWARGEKIPKLSGYRTGGWVRYLSGDIMTTIEAIQERGRPGVPSPLAAVSGFLLSFLQPMSYDYVDWKDPLPAFKATTHFLGSWVGGAIKKRLTYLQKGASRERNI